jgi:hypothetical protein
MYAQDDLAQAWAAEARDRAARHRQRRAARAARARRRVRRPAQASGTPGRAIDNGGT